MSCNGCRVLRKGCSESCVLRPCLQWIQPPEAQGHATVFVAKFFGRAGLMSFISNVPDAHRPALFQSLLYEACGRTVNPVSGAVGLLWTGNWQICQAAVDTVLRGGTLRPVPEFLNGAAATTPDSDEASEVIYPNKGRLHQDFNSCSNSPHQAVKRQKSGDRSPKSQLAHLDLTSAIPDFPVPDAPSKKMRRPATPSLNSEESGTTISFESVYGGDQLRRPAPVPETKLLNLFV